MSQQPYYPPPQTMQVPRNVAELIDSYYLGRVPGSHQESGSAGWGIALLLLGGFFALTMLCPCVAIIAFAASHGGISLTTAQGTLSLILLLGGCGLFGLVLAALQQYD